MNPSPEESSQLLGTVILLRVLAPMRLDAGNSVIDRISEIGRVNVSELGTYEDGIILSHAIALFIRSAN
jgi:hypothetical protein